MDTSRQEKTIPELERSPAPKTPPESLNLSAPEMAAEKKEAPEKSPPPEIEPPKQEKGLLSKLLPKKKKKIPSISPRRDELSLKVEKILEQNIREPYEKLSPVARQEFKIKGEETASKISELLRATRVKVKKIFTLVLEWLFLLPGVNKFFLEQEAKIKTDQIIALKDQGQK